MPGINLKNIKGFTLIEILISLGIIALVAAVSIPNLRGFNKYQEIDNAALQLINTFRSAQSSAASHIKCPANEAATSWQVDLTVAGANDTYSLISNCLTQGPKTIINNTPFAATPTDQTTFQADTDRCPGQNISIYFTNLQVTYQCANGAILEGTVVITISPSGGTSCTGIPLCKTVIVGLGGVIR